MTGFDPDYLFWAAQAGIVKNVKRYVNSGADVDVTDQWGNTALHIAALHGKPEVASLLCAAGADRDAKDARGATPTEVAQAQGRVDVVGVLTA
jgi:ankyrin repeat protein